jgi:iron complex outermembrane receptor protein
MPITDTGAFRHALRGGVLVSRASTLAPPQAFNFAGTGNVSGDGPPTPPAPLPLSEASLRKERSTEAYLRARTQWDEASQLWWGLRHTRLARSGGEADYDQGFTTPWLAYTRDLAPQLGPGWMGYASWGQGVETAVAPNLVRYTNRGEPLPALRSRQVEAGLKRDSSDWSATLAAFGIRRPQTADIGDCTSDTTPDCTRVQDGRQVHRGLEAHGDLRATPTTRYGASATWLDAMRTGSADPAQNGKRPPNVPERAARAQVRHSPEAARGLSLGADVVYEGDRTLLPGNEDLRIPSWTRLDLSFGYEPPGTSLTWRGGIDNATNRRAWRESPFQFDHVYLFPLAPRTAWLTLEVQL